ncbi:MAG TPA: PEGA domain-containing protein [Gemmataceae bacterium]|jgi:hypothetical protein|nr:PEGA domain-containing protein [Gemmataceae bacterium]
MKRTAGLGALLLLAGGLSAGCVERRYTIYSDPPGAVVYRNGQQLGPTPVDDSFVYYGKYHFVLVKEGYETLVVEQNISTPWYEYPPLDFVSESLVGSKIRDVRTFTYTMQPLQAPRHDEVLQRGTTLRDRGKTIGDQPPEPPANTPPLDPPTRNAPVIVPPGASTQATGREARPGERPEAPAAPAPDGPR